MVPGHGHFYGQISPTQPWSYAYATCTCACACNYNYNCGLCLWCMVHPFVLRSADLLLPARTPYRHCTTSIYLRRYGRLTAISPLPGGLYRGAVCPTPTTPTRRLALNGSKYTALKLKGGVVNFFFVDCFPALGASGCYRNVF